MTALIHKIILTCLIHSSFGHIGRLILDEKTFTTGQGVSDRFECPKVLDIPQARQELPALNDEEIKKLSQDIFNKHVNYFTDHLSPNYQAFNSEGTEDLAPQMLLTVKKDIWNIPTVSAFQALLDNYVRNTSIAEDVTEQEKAEEVNFLNLIMDTLVMTTLMDALTNKGLVPQDRSEQMKILHTIWFDLYPRQKKRKNKKLSSSGFEHVFLSEVRGGKILGFHNWIYFHTMEELKNVNYWGYIKKIDLNNNMGLLKFSMDMNGVRKPVNSIFIGTSPEFEMAIYSLCFLARADKRCRVLLNGNTVNIRTHSYNYDGKKLVGSAFPEL